MIKGMAKVGQKTMTVQEVANMLKVSTDTVKNCIHRTMPNRLQNGRRTYLTELEVAAIKKELTANDFVNSQLQDAMTIQQVANVLHVSYDTVRNCIVRIMPDRLKHGKTTMLTELEVAAISKELKNNTQVTNQLTVEAGSTVANATTELELMEDYRRASEAIIKMLSEKKAMLEKQNNKLAIENESYKVQYDEDKQWRTIKWMEKQTGEHYNWRELKKASEDLGIKPKKVFDQNYGEVNAYHIDAWQRAYGDDVVDVIEEDVNE